MLIQFCIQYDKVRHPLRKATTLELHRACPAHPAMPKEPQTVENGKSMFMHCCFHSCMVCRTGFCTWAWGTSIGHRAGGSESSYRICNNAVHKKSCTTVYHDCGCCMCKATTHSINWAGWCIGHHAAGRRGGRWSPARACPLACSCTAAPQALALAQGLCIGPGGVWPACAQLEVAEGRHGTYIVS